MEHGGRRVGPARRRADRRARGAGWLVAVAALVLALVPALGAPLIAQSRPVPLRDASADGAAATPSPAVIAADANVDPEPDASPTVPEDQGNPDAGSTSGVGRGIVPRDSAGPPASDPAESRNQSVRHREPLPPV